MVDYNHNKKEMFTISTRWRKEKKKSSSHWIDSIWNITVVSVFVGVIVKKI